MGTSLDSRSKQGVLFTPSILGLLLLICLGTGGCRAVEPVSPEPADWVVVESTATAESAVQTAAESSVPEPTQEVDHCLDCHTDQERLKAVANPVVVLESESSGEG